MIRSDRNRNGGQGLDPYASGSAAQKKLIPALGCQRLFFNHNNNLWYKFDHSNEQAPSHTPIAGGVYDPPFEVRAMKIEAGQGGEFVKHDMVAQDMQWTREEYTEKILHRVTISRVWLANNHADTTCDAVTLYA